MSDSCEDDEIIQEFMIEAGELLEQLDRDLVLLEETPQDLALLDQIFRAAHTIKGNAGFLGFDKLMEFTHQSENVLDRLRSGKMSVTQPVMDLILEAVDMMKLLMENLADDNGVDTSSLIRKLQASLEAPSEPAKPEATASADDDMGEIIHEFMIEAGELLEQVDQDLLKLEETPQDLALLDQIFRSVHTIKGNAGFLGFDKLMEFTHQSENVLDRLRSGKMSVTQPVMDLILEAIDTMKALMQHLQDENAVETTGTVARLEACLKGELETLAVQPAKGGEPSRPTAPKKKSQEDQTIRVDVSRLDDLMNLAGELVIAKNRLQQFAHQFDAHFGDSDLAESLVLTTGMITFITGQLQETVMKTRLMPIKKVFSRIPRMVRDLSRDTHKKVNLIVQGEDTELDKSVIEHIGDPLMHIIRNAIDHGLETPPERTLVGKPAEGTIRLTAYSEGNYIIIEIVDDGKGMNADIIARKAVEKGIIEAEDLPRLSEREKLDFIFAPGFSTAETVSDISGRGVGMNVVKENIEKLDGLIDILTAVGQGTNFKIQLPLTMAIVPALLVRAGTAMFAIPLANISETLVVQQEDIYTIDGKEVLYLRDRIISLTRLNHLLSLDEPARPQDKQYILIVGVAEMRLGLVVDQLLGQEEVVIKSLGPFFSHISMIAGATIMGDGCVVLILDVAAIIHHVARKMPLALNS